MKYKITSGFWEKENFRDKPHTGIDFKMEIGEPLRSIKDGVAHIYDYGNKNAGKTVIIEGDDGKKYIYGHLSEFKVQDGQIVNKGDMIGLSGNTGNSTGAHLHFGLKDASGKFIDPSSYIDLIQNMNNPNFIKQHVKQHVADTIQKTNFSDFVQQHADIFNKSMEILKVQLVHVHDFALNIVINVCDYAFLMQIFQ